MAAGIGGFRDRERLGEEQIHSRIYRNQGANYEIRFARACTAAPRATERHSAAIQARATQRTAAGEMAASG